MRSSGKICFSSNHVCLLAIVFLLFSSILAISAQGKQASSKQPGAASRSIPLGGNTYLTSKFQLTEEVEKYITKSGINNWTSGASIFSAYFRTSRQGNLNLYLKYSTDAPSKIKVSCRKKSFIVDLPQGNDNVIYIGSVQIPDTGYVKVDFQGLERKGNTFAQASNLIIDGNAATGELNYVDDFSFYWGRRGPSVHLKYLFPENETIEWFYSEITVPLGEDPIGSYYMANGFGQGYFGMQVNSATERRVLFSVWSPFQTDNPNDIPDSLRIKMLKKGEGVRTGEFGNEGSGGQSYLIYPWKTGNTYKFLTRIKPDGKGATQYTSYFYATDEKKWLLIASFLRPQTDTYYTNAHSFLESFIPELGYRSRKALYGNQWARTKAGKWIEITDSRFSADETARKKARMDYKGGAENDKFFLQNCGFLSNYTTIGNSFSRKAAGKVPGINLEDLPE